MELHAVHPSLLTNADPPGQTPHQSQDQQLDQHQHQHTPAPQHRVFYARGVRAWFAPGRTVVL
eukprot:7353581-Prorocentrum_lima.AAC.1